MRRQELFIRFALILVCAGFWLSGLNYLSFPLLGIAWIIDGGPRRLSQVIKLPLAQAIVLLCVLLLIGLSWSELPHDGRMKWLKYFILLIVIPFYSLLNNERLPWAAGGLVTGYLVVLILGVYQWLVPGGQGIPLLGMSYLSFSAMLGAGAIVAVAIACQCRSARLEMVLWGAGLALIFVQFYQNGRMFLLATLITLLFLAFLRYKIEIRKFTGIAITVLMITGIFAYSSPVFQERLVQVRSDIELLQQGNYSSSLGYRFAMWDVGLHAIAERPFTGYGTGAPERYFDTAILTYKNGLYKDLPAFQKTSHYHNEWIEIGMHAGIPGMLALLFLYRGWYLAFKRNGLNLLGAGLVCYVFLAGLTDTFMIFSRTPVLLLMITAIAMSWRKQESLRM